MTVLFSACNQPPWLNECLREIEARAGLLTNWEWYFVGKIRTKIENSIVLNDWEQDKLSKIRGFVMRRRQKPQEKYVPKQPKKQLKNWSD